RPVARRAGAGHRQHGRDHGDPGASRGTLVTPISQPNPGSAHGAHGSVLVVNSGSSSIKYQLVNPVGGEAIASGIVERIGEDVGSVRHTYGGNTTERNDP